MNHVKRKYGWHPDVPDHHDRPFVTKLTGAILPRKVDLSAGLVHIYDQGQLGSCTANAIAGAFQFARKKEGLPAWDPSRLFIYFNERDAEGHVPIDSGACLRTGIKSLVKLGVCPESMWPYDISQFTVKPTEACYAEATKDQVLQYRRVAASHYDMKCALTEGHPFVVGIAIFQSFESDPVRATGMIPMPGQDESLLGGHAVLCVGCDDDTRLYRLANSWGPDWGDHGFFHLPYDYMTTLANDRWVISKTE